jgi:ApaG protein
MIEKISEGIRITVQTRYQPEFSNPANSEFMFAYKVFITNNNDFPIQLLSRHWHIFDSIGVHRDVAGDGVVGEQPIIYPGNTYHYTSGCNLNSEMGKMSGTYSLVNLLNKKAMTALIPAFELVADFKQN